MSRRGFTLLEVVVALAILGVSLVAILNINLQAVTSHLYAKRLTVATLLARSKMTDIEQELYDKPLSVDDEEDSGDFGDDGWPSYKWRSKIIVPKTNGLSPEQLFGALFNLPLGGGGEGKDGLAGLMGGLFGASGKTPPGAPPGGASGADQGAGAGILGMLGPMAGLASAQFTQMVDTLTKSVREVHLTVSWKEGKLTESIDLVTHVVSLGPGSDINGGAVAAQGGGANGGQSGPAGEQWVRADNGMPAPNAHMGPNGTMVDTDNSPVVTMAQFTAQRGGLAPGQLNPFLPGNLPPRTMVPQGTGKILPAPGLFQ